MTNRNHNLNDRDAITEMHIALTSCLAFMTRLHTDNLNSLDDAKYDDFDATNMHNNARFDAMNFSDDDTDYAPAAANLIAALTTALYLNYEYETPSTNLDNILDDADNIADFLTAPHDSTKLYDIAETLDAP